MQVQVAVEVVRQHQARPARLEVMGLINLAAAQTFLVCLGILAVLAERPQVSPRLPEFQVLDFRAVELVAAAVLTELELPAWPEP
jgi:hypothetical protein